MAVVRCPEGHFFDDQKFDSCPHCMGGIPKPPSPGAVRALADQQTVAKASSDDVARRALAQRQLNSFAQGGAKRDEKTIGLFQSQKGYDPVVAWLVCVEGREKGRDYRLHAGRNFVGRAYNMDVSLPDDEQVHRDNHCSIVYEPRNSVFMLVAGEGSVPLLNGDQVREAAGLSEDDIIEIGGSRFQFVPFCKERRTW